jgi:type II secretory pathway component PulK
MRMRTAISMPAETGFASSPPAPSFRRRSPQAGSVLIIVLWVSFGLVSLTLYFAQSMSLELRAADNRVAGLEAGQAIAGAARYVSNVLATAQVQGTLPDIQLYASQAVPVGSANFWLIGRPDRQPPPDQPVFGLVDEASKLNLNTATLEMLEMLPGMTPELAAAIIDWRDSNDTASSGGAESEVYQRMNPAYRCKNASFESVDELRLVYGMYVDILLGEDANLNGILDPNENDSMVSLPYDNRDGRLDAGLLEYVTVYSREPNTRTNGSARVNVSGPDQQQLAALLEEKGISTDRANQILLSVGSTSAGGGGGPGGGAGGAGGGGGATTTAAFRSVLEFYTSSSTAQNGLTPDEFALIEPDITVSTNSSTEGLVNVNTASEAVLACIPGIGTEFAATLVSQRQAQRASLSYQPSLAWVADVLGQTNAVQAGPYLTAYSYQFTADIAALGHHGRGYQRVKFIFDTSEGAPKILYRQDLTHLGWALGAEVRKTLLLAKDKR